MIKTHSLSHITAGMIAVIVGFTSSIAIIFQAAAACGATSAEVSSWVLALGFGMAISSIGLSLYYRIPILIAWSTPGAALLVTSLSGIPLSEAIGAFVFSSILILISGLSGIFAKVINRIPSSLASAMLAGILFHFGLSIFIAMQQQFLIVITIFIAYLIGKRIFPRLVILLILLLGIFLADIKGLLHLQHFHFAFSSPVFIAPHFSLPVLISVGIPLFVVTMTSQNIPGITVLKAAGYKPCISPIISWTGITNLLMAPFGGFAFNLAAITAAICASEEADSDPARRYKASIYAGLFYLIAGLFGATIVALFSALPNELVLAIAGIALLGTIGNSVKIAMGDDAYREPALITLLVTSSGMTLFGIGPAFWGLIAGVMSLILLNSYKNKNLVPIS